MKKILTLLPLSFLFSLSLKADYWTQKADFPAHKRTLPISFGMGSYGYIGWGTDTTNMSVKDLWAYNANTNSWSQKASLPGTNNSRSGAVCYVNPVTGKAYAGLGQNTLGTLFQDWWEYNTATNIWTAKANFPGGTRTLASAFFANGYGYVGMGNGGTGDFNDLWLYEPVSDSWQSKAVLPATYGRREATTFTIGTKGYVVTGYSTALTSSLLDVYEYETTNNTWTLRNSFFGDARYGASSFTLYDHGYTGIGKTVLSVYATDFFQYDYATDSWYQRTNFGGVGRFEGASFAIRDSGYFGCGGSPSSFYRDLWKYTPDTFTTINEYTNYNVQFTIYPNPAKEFVVISSELGVKENLEITIANVQGKKVYQADLRTPNSGLQAKIDVRNFSNGIYFITAGNGKQKTTKKFLKE